jgi:hypothetical protein
MKKLSHIGHWIELNCSHWITLVEITKISISHYVIQPIKNIVFFFFFSFFNIISLTVLDNINFHNFRHNLMMYCMLVDGK